MVHPLLTHLYLFEEDGNRLSTTSSSTNQGYHQKLVSNLPLRTNRYHDFGAQFVSSYDGAPWPIRSTHSHHSGNETNLQYKFLLKPPSLYLGKRFTALRALEHFAAPRAFHHLRACTSARVLRKTSHTRRISKERHHEGYAFRPLLFRDRVGQPVHLRLPENNEHITTMHDTTHTVWVRGDAGLRSNRSSACDAHERRARTPVAKQHARFLSTHGKGLGTAYTRSGALATLSRLLPISMYQEQTLGNSLARVRGDDEVNLCLNLDAGLQHGVDGNLVFLRQLAHAPEYPSLFPAK